MTHDERQALRKKHIAPTYFCRDCLRPFPCDTIKVLDAWDFERAMQKIEDISVELDLPE